MNNKGLWLTEERRALLAGRHSPSGQPWLDSLLEAALSPGESGSRGNEDGPDGVVALGLRAWFQSDSGMAEDAARRWIDGQRKQEQAQDLGKAHVALAGAVLFDACAPLWSAAVLRQWGEALCDRAASLFSISPANPHAIANNWWAVTHSGLYVAAAALNAAGFGDRPVAGRTVGEVEEWAWQRLDAFLGQIGEAGAFHEGLGYQDYACAYLLPAVLLRRNRSTIDPLECFPGLRRMAELIFCSGMEGPKLDDATGTRTGWGRQLSWNDAGLGWSENAVPLLALLCADAQQQPALLAMWNRLSGYERPCRTVVRRFGALFFQAAYYPDGMHPEDPEAVLPHVICDRKQGLWMARNRYQDSLDAVAGAYARASHPGGHSQNDAGSIRFSALGWDWVLGGGQARPAAEWQSVVTSSDPEPEPGCGAVLWQAGTVFAMDLRKVHVGYSERYVSLYAQGPVALGVLDLVDDHRDDRDWIWNLTFSPEHKLTIPPDHSGFLLTAPDATTLAVHFLGTRPLSLSCVVSPASSRTYSNGRRVDYPGRPCVKAFFPRVKPLNIYAVLTASPPGHPAPAPRLVGGTGIAWGDDIWERPFGLALASELAPGSIRTQCPFPGVD